MPQVGPSQSGRGKKKKTKRLVSPLTHKQIDWHVDPANSADTRGDPKQPNRITRAARRRARKVAKEQEVAETKNLSAKRGFRPTPAEKKLAKNLAAQYGEHVIDQARNFAIAGKRKTINEGDVTKAQDALKWGATYEGFSRRSRRELKKLKKQQKQAKEAHKAGLAEGRRLRKQEKKEKKKK